MPAPIGHKKAGGRQKGTLNKKSQALVEAVAKQGIMPLDYMLSVLRNETNPPKMRYTAAVDCAPYLHPKLQSTQSKITLSNHEEALSELE